MYGMHQKEDLGKGQEGQVYCDFSYIMYVCALCIYISYIIWTRSHDQVVRIRRVIKKWLYS